MLSKAPALMRQIVASLAGASLALSAAPAIAQSIETIDPDEAIDADLIPPGEQVTASRTVPARDVIDENPGDPALSVEDAGFLESDNVADQPVSAASPDVINAASAPVEDSTTYKEDDLIGAAEGVFGKGAEGLAGLIQDVLSKQGEPNAYIVGREGGGALVIGVRYGSGTLFHKIEGERPVYWTGPSIGFDAGANAGNTFVLVYNLFDSEELYKRYPAGEGQAYFVGGFNASYMRRGDVVLIPVRVGAGLRLGVNAGYMKFSKKQRWLPF